MTASLRRAGCRALAPSYFANLELEADSDVFSDSRRRSGLRFGLSHTSRGIARLPMARRRSKAIL